MGETPAGLEDWLVRFGEELRASLPWRHRHYSCRSLVRREVRGARRQVGALDPELVTQPYTVVLVLRPQSPTTHPLVHHQYRCKSS